MDAPRLLADIGGTHARFALSGPDGQPAAVRKLRAADYPGLVEAVRAYLGDRQVREAVFAVATPVGTDRIKFTNSPWTFSIEATRKALGLERLVVINDFTAQALAIPVLREQDRAQICDGAAVPGEPIAVIGPGTGLGVAGLLRVDGAWHPIPSEGGHVSAATHDDVEAAVIAVLRRRLGHVSNERLLAAPGLVNLANALAELGGQRLELRNPNEVTARAQAGDCPFCIEALARFSSLLGAAAGDLALMFCARGGVYIGGGLVKRLGPLFNVARYRAAFVAKGRFEAYLAAIPTFLVTRQDPGLLGAASLRLSP
jgi:glucokinase